MTIFFYDGGRLTCNTIEFGMNGNLIADEYRIVPVDEIVRIVEGEYEAEASL